MTNKIPFTSARHRNPENVLTALENDCLGVRGQFSEACGREIQKQVLDNAKVYMTTSATVAMETMAWAIPITGEVIMPSWNFASAASAFYRAGHTPVFVDCLFDSLCIDPEKVKEAITPATVAVLAMDYAGSMANMFSLRQICQEHGVMLLEDAAAAYMTPGAALASDMAAFSFNDTKNIGCGEGGALIVNVDKFNNKIEQLLDKGTNVTKVRRDRSLDQYTWTAPGTAGRMTELTAAVLLQELENAVETTLHRKNIWDRYRSLLQFSTRSGMQQMRFMGNGHFYWVMAPTPTIRKYFMEFMLIAGIYTQRHYMALHESPMASMQCRARGSVAVSKWAEQCIVRLPIYRGIADRVDYVCEQAIRCADSAYERAKAE